MSAKKLNAAIMFRFVKRWQNLQRLTKRVELDTANFARELRRAFVSGVGGDQLFLTWCETELHTSVDESRELLTRALAMDVFHNLDALNVAGGFRQARLVYSRTRDEQISIFTEARDQVLTIGTVISRRSKPSTERPRPAMDAQALAEFILRKMHVIPPAIRAIVSRYVIAEHREAA